MVAIFCIADTEDGRSVDDPSPDALAALISGLNQDDNTFLTLNPVDDTAAWYGSVSLLPDGDYKVDLANPDRPVREIAFYTHHSTIAQHVSDWLTGLQRTS